MSILESLFSGAKAFFRGVLAELDRSVLGRAIAGFLTGATSKHFGTPKYFNTARDLADEERELAAKRARDKQRTEADEERMQEIEEERAQQKKQMDEDRAAAAAKEFKDNEADMSTVELTDSEICAAVGIISTKECPVCGGTMSARIHARNVNTKRWSFYWLCASGVCPTIKLNPSEGVKVARRGDPFLDMNPADRKVLLDDKKTIVETATRLRGALGEDDLTLTCPHHLLPLRLLPTNKGKGRLLESYEYVCVGVDTEGCACQHRVPLETFPQVSEVLRRREGYGIIR